MKKAFHLEYVELCRNCRGTGIDELTGWTCPTCEGSGRVLKKREGVVTIEPYRGQRPGAKR